MVDEEQDIDTLKEMRRQMVERKNWKEVNRLNKIIDFKLQQKERQSNENKRRWDANLQITCRSLDEVIHNDENTIKRLESLWLNIPDSKKKGDLDNIISNTRAHMNKVRDFKKIMNCRR